MQPRKPLHFVNTIVVLVGKRQSTDPQCEEVLPSACSDIVAADPSVCAKDCLYKKCPVACGHCSEYYFKWNTLLYTKTFALKIKMHFTVYYESYLPQQSQKIFLYKENDIHVTFFDDLILHKKDSVIFFYGLTPPPTL